MPNQNLTETLQSLVRHYGMSSVLHSLADLQNTPDQPVFSPRQSRKSKSKPSAIVYVENMPLPPDKAEVMARVAHRFEERSFLPSVADVREFCRIHNIKLGKSTSRASSIPRLFTFLAAMDTDTVIKILNNCSYSGPARLAPIADAIRSYSANRSQQDHTKKSPLRSDPLRSELTATGNKKGK